ncbi:MAG: prepilin-type N-terminal cleavage/methylation domain-containing protein [Candidatus Falkowbacteria bacterium]|nr:prepilin-type N-terminal cleavage/methylation domain-containing protein [Candidatus Falkowbacteria bacterium]
MNNTHKQNGFTFIELVTVVAVVAALMTLAVVSFNRPRIQGRDSKRVNDIKAIQTALELYYNRNNSYPTYIIPGQLLGSGNNVYLNPVPTNQAPRNDGNCGNNEYTYSALDDNKDYEINFCLGGDTDKNSNATMGSNVASKNGINVAPGLVAWWKLNENTGNDAYDTTGNNNICHHNPAPEISGFFWGDLPSCKTGLCAQFNGIANSYLDCGQSDAYLVNSGSISLWFKADNSISNSDNRLVEIGSDINPELDMVSLIWNGANVYLQEIKAAGEIATLNSNTDTDLQTDTWYYVVGTWDSTGANIYVKGDGVNIVNSASGDSTLALPQGHTILSIGNNTYGDFNNPWNGNIDDVRIYNRALSATEIQAIYNSLK